MGWLFMTLAGMGKHPTPKAYLDNQLNYEPTTDRPGLILPASAMIERVYYGAISSTERPDTISAVICLTKWNPRAADNMVFGYKDMDENSGPYNYGCPARILDLLTPTNHPHATEWRSKCRAAITLTSRPKPAPGDRIRLTTPGGGGYGDPREREAWRIEEDLREGYVSDASATRDYDRHA